MTYGRRCALVLEMAAAELSARCSGGRWREIPTRATIPGLLPDSGPLPSTLESASSRRIRHGSARGRGQGSRVSRRRIRTARPSRSEDFKGQKVVLYFYPKDDTPGCTKEACSFRDGWSKFRKREASRCSASRPTTRNRTSKFADKFSLPFPLLADTDKAIVKRLRSLGREEHVRPQVHGHAPRDVPDRREGKDRGGLAEGQAGRARGRGARGGTSQS